MVLELKQRNEDVILSSRQKDGVDNAADPSPFNPLMTRRETAYMIETDPIVNKWRVRVTGYKLRYKGESQVYLDSGFTWDHTLDTFIQLDTTVTIDLTVNGPNGLDTGTEIPDSWYYVFVIFNPITTDAAGLFSRSTIPTLPSGYTKYRRVGVIRNAFGSIRQFVQRGFGSDRTYYWEDKSNNLMIVSGANNTTYRDLSAGDHIPRDAIVGYLGLLVDGGTALESGMIRPYRRPYDFYRQAMPNTQIYTDCVMGVLGLLEYKVTTALQRFYISVIGFFEVLS